MEIDKKNKVLMLGPARDVKGGMTAVVNGYYDYGLDKEVDLKYIETINDKNILSKILKEIRGKIEFLLNINKYDIVHIHMATRRSTFRKLKYLRKAKKRNKKVILHIHGAEYKPFYSACSQKQKQYIKDTFNLADKIIVLSEEWKDYFKNIVNEKKIEVIYNFVFIPEKFEKNLNRQRILFLGRMGERKGIYDLIDVVERLSKEYPEVLLEAYGDGEVAKVKKIIKQKNLQKNIEVSNWIEGKEKEEKLKNAVLYVLPSYNEGMPMSVLEGMAYENIPISTIVGGIPKVIVDNENGMLIEPGDKEKLYEDIKQIFENYELRKKISHNARKTIEEKFDINKNIRKLIELYSKI